MSPTDGFDKLRDGNYYHWEYNVRMKLMRKGLVAHIVRPESDKTYDRSSVQWMENDLKALGMIAGAVEYTHQVYIRDAQTALEAWTRLQLHHNRDSMKNQIMINKKLHNFKMQDGVNMTNHIDQFKELVFQLQSIGNSMSESQQIVLLLGSLGSQYDVLVSILENTPNITLPQVMETLVNSARDKETVLDSEELAFRIQRGHSDKSFEGNCHHCGKKGHKRKDCWQLHGRKRGGFSGRGRSSGGGGRRGGFGNHHAARAQQDFAFSALATKGSRSQNKDWLVDSGASSHMCWDINQFTSVIKLETPIQVRIADGQWIAAEGRGNVRIVLTDGTVMALSDVLFIPELDRNLLSVPALTAYDVAVRFLRGTCIFMFRNRRIFSATKISGGFYLAIEPPTVTNTEFQQNAMSAVTMSAWEEVHAKMCHIPPSLYKRLSEVVEGVPNVPSGELDMNFLCDGCCYGKMRAGNFPRNPAEKVKTTRPLELVHSDVFGPVHISTPGGARYGIVFIDDFTRRTWIDFMRQKSEAMTKFKDFMVRVEKESGKEIQRLRTDNGGEYTSNAFKRFLREVGIAHETTTPHTPQQNGLAERTVRSVTEKTRCNLYHKNMSLNWWAEAANTAVRMMNMTPNSVTELTPDELWTGKRPDMKNAQIFGEVGFAHVTSEKKKKLEPRAFKCTFMGYAEGTKGYRVLNHETNKIQIVRTIKMATVNRQLKLSSDMAEYGDTDDEDDEHGDASQVPSRHHSDRSERASPDLFPNRGRMDMMSDSTIVFPVRQRVVRKSDEVNGVLPARKTIRHNNDLTAKDWTRIDQRKYQRQNDDTEIKDARHSDTNHVDYEIALAANVVPSSYTAAMTSNEAGQWRTAMRSELHSLEQNRTWDLCPLPAGRKPVGCRWVFAYKTNEKGEVIRHKARLVAQGFSQRYGEDYQDTYSPVANATSVRLFLAVTCSEGMMVEQCDVDTAFLNGELEEEIYMQMPEGIDSLSEEGELPTVSPRSNGIQTGKNADTVNESVSTAGAQPLVCRLRKSLYGLKQASRVWNKTIDKTLRDSGFEPTAADRCVYVKGKGDSRCMICLYVDDLLVAGTNQASISSVKAYLGTKFKIKELGSVRFVLGIEVRYDPKQRVLQLLQRSYIDQIAEKFNQTNAKPTFIPAEPGLNLDTQSHVEFETTSRRPYRSVVGCLMYLAGCTRPDIAVTVLKLSQHLENPTEQHWKAAIRLVRYRKTTRDYGLHYDGNMKRELLAYSDADWGSSTSDRRSLSGSVIMMCGGPVAWKATVQKSVALSSTEAEYMALSACVKECVWARQLVRELTTQPVGVTTIRADNQGAIALANNNGYHARTKHIDIRYHFVREKIESGDIQLSYVPTEYQLADFLTKLMSGKRLRFLLEGVGLLPTTSTKIITT